MRDRIQRAIDGELPEAQLTPEEARELRQYHESISAGLSSLPDEPAPDVSRAVMGQIAELEPLPSWAPGAAARPWLALAAAVRWLWAPRSLAVRLRPGFAIATTAALAVLAWAGAARLIAPRAPAQVLVQFRLGSADARQVSLAGDFTGWRPEHQMHELAPGVWSVVIPLAPGVYDYAFVIDGRSWRVDPLAPRVEDGFGGANSRVTVLAPEPAPRVL